MPDPVTTRPRASVYLITYNHAAHIRQALDGILMQRTDLPFEIIVHDDASTDGTTDLIRDYEARYPDRIFPIYRKENLYSQGKKHLIHRDSIAKARGQYLALCEGDDYWTDTKKLQKQVDFLEAHPECSACYTNAAVVNENGNPKPSIYLGEGPPVSLMIRPAKSSRTQADIFSLLAIPTCTLCCRVQYLRDLPEWVARVKTGDWALAMVLSGHGPIQYLDEVTATYRRHGGGTWSSLETMLTLKYGLERMEIFSHYAAPDRQPSMAKDIHAARSKVRRHAAGVLAAGLEKGSEFGGEFQKRDLVGLFGRQESRRIRMVARETYFQQAYFKKKPLLARSRAISLICRYPEWLLRRGSLGQAIRALTGRI